MSQPLIPVTILIDSTTPGVATVTPTTLLFTSTTWQIAQPVTVLGLADGVTQITLVVQTADPDYARVSRRTATVRVGVDPAATMAPWLVRFGRTLTGQAVNGVTARLRAPRTPGVTGTVAGYSLAGLVSLFSDAPAAPAQARLTPLSALTPAPDPRLNPNAGDQQLNVRDLLAGSAFTLTSTPTADGASYALWGQGSWNRFAGQAATLALHADEDFESWGAAATLQWDPTPTTLTGPSLALRQAYGGPASGGSQAFWTEDPLTTTGAASAPAALRLAAEFAWGFALGDSARIGVPTLAYGWAPASRDLALGWRLPAIRSTDLTVDLTATRREAVRTLPVHGVRLSLTRNW